jgi:hypothetical protein
LVGGGGGAHALAGEGVPISTRGRTLWYSRYGIYVLCVVVKGMRLLEP